MTTLDSKLTNSEELHFQFVRELTSPINQDMFVDIFNQRDSDDGQEDTSIPSVLGGGGSFDYPLQLVKSADSETLYVRYGTVGGVIPTIAAIPLDADETSNVLSFAASGTTSFYLNCVIVETNGIQSVDSVSIETTSVSESETATSRLLGTVVALNGTISTVSNVLQGSQNVDSCGTLHSWNLV